MKNYKITSKGKVIFSSIFVLLVVLLMIQSQVALIGFGIILSILVFLSIDFYLSTKKESHISKVQESSSKIKQKSSLSPVHENPLEYNEEIQTVKIQEKKQKINAEKDIAGNDDSNIDTKEISYKDVIEDIDELDETLKTMASDLKEIAKVDKTFQKKQINSEVIKDLESYYLNKRKEINPVEKKEEKRIESIETLSILEMLKDFFGTLIKRNPYKLDSLVYHDHFGVGQVIESSDHLKVSFYNNQLKDIIEFEFDNKGNVPEIKSFQIPKGEDRRHYHYNYKKDISKALLETLEQLKLNFKDVVLLPNISLANEGGYENYTLIVLSDLIHVFYFEEPPALEPLTYLLEMAADEFSFKTHQVHRIEEVNSILFKEKVKSQIDISKVERIKKLILEENIENYSERQHLQSN